MISEIRSEKIIVRHGTDTMIETGRYLAERITDRLIVITETIRPERFSYSDAGLDLSCDIGTVNQLHIGVYITIHGIIKPYDKIERDLDTGK